MSNFVENLHFRLDELEDLLKKHEGYEEKPYIDTVGKVTIGVGYNLTDRGLPRDMIEVLLFRCMQESIQDCRSLFVNFNEFSGNRQLALIDMMFNLGRGKLSKFVNMRKAIANGDWILAADEALNSKWATQVGNRAKTIADMLKKG